VTIERLLLVLVIGVFIVVAVNQFGGTSAGALEGQQAPGFSLPALRRDQPWELSELRGRVVVLNFWASWCGPCRMEMPQIQSIHEEFSDRPVTVLAVNHAEEPETARGFIEAEGYTMPVALDQARTASSQYGVPPIPRLLVIAPDGTVVLDQVGYRSGSTEEIRQIIETHLPTREAA
jgi:thiol-disulfide isomerase/thioredoxin